MTKSWHSYSCPAPDSYPSVKSIVVPRTTTCVIGGGGINEGRVQIDVYEGIFCGVMEERKIAFSNAKAYQPDFKSKDAIELVIRNEKVFVFLEDVSP